MGCDLQVDTGGIRRAAALFDEAGQAYRRQLGDYFGSPMADWALGSSAAAREATATATTRAGQALELTHLLATAASDMATRLRRSADEFERIEHECRPGG